MAIYFRLSSVPELQAFPREMRHVVVQRCFGYAAQIPATSVAPVMALVAVPTAGIFLGAVLSLFVSFVAPFPVVALLAVGFWVIATLGLAIAIFPLAVRSDRIRLRRAIAIYGDNYRLPVCARCDYDLRGSDSDQCPECGAPTRLQADEWR
ncbi:MAG: hypothetical protein AAF593_01650 [Planctomycetota bacterium]